MSPAAFALALLLALPGPGGLAGAPGQAGGDGDGLPVAASAFMPDSIGHPDRSAILGRDFSGAVVTENAPEGADWAERAAWTVRKQLSGRDYYKPATYMFLRPAIHELGFFPAIFATFDRITRDNRLGAAHIPGSLVEEGPEAYAPARHARADRASGGLPAEPALTEKEAVQ